MTNRITNTEPLARASLKGPRKQKVWVWRLKGKEKGTVELYSPEFHGFTVHYNPSIRRSSKHIDDKERCQGCQDELPTKEVFYLFGWHVEKARLVFLELPRGAADKVTELLAGGETFRGLCLYVERSTADNGRLSFRFLQNHSTRPKLLPDRSPEETLLALWGEKQHHPRQVPEVNGHANGFFSSNGAK